MSITALAYAEQTLTSDATIPTANDTVTIGGKVYTYKASVTTTDGEVDLGSTAAEALTNLKAAINADPAGAGTLFGSATPANEYVVATTLTATTLKVVAKTPGKFGNFITTAAASTHLSWGAAALAGGTGHVYTAISEILSTEQPNSSIAQILKSIDSDGAAN